MSQEEDDLPEIDGLLDGLENLARNNDRVTLDQVLESLGARGFGPLLVVFSAFLILPIGMVPGIPAIVGLIFIVIGGHMLVRSHRLWLPAMVKRASFSASVLKSSVRRARPAEDWLRPVLAPRLSLLVEGALPIGVIALVVIATGLLVMVVGFIPFVPLALSLHVLLFGLALTARDGVVGLVAYGVLAPELYLLWILLP
ncbi:MAG: exopolysaccharide biosynthesis protein [Paracoccaceae bacterium]